MGVKKTMLAKKEANLEGVSNLKKNKFGKKEANLEGRSKKIQFW